MPKKQLSALCSELSREKGLMSIRTSTTEAERVCGLKNSFLLAVSCKNVPLDSVDGQAFLYIPEYNYSFSS